MKLVQDELYDAEVRVENIIWVPGVVCAEAAPGILDELASSMPERAASPLYKAFPSLLKFAEEYPDVDDVAEELRNASGFIVQAATPVRNYIGDGDIFFSGWGAYYTEWLYAATEAGIAPACIEWAVSRHEVDLASFKSAAAAKSEAA